MFFAYPFGFEAPTREASEVTSAPRRALPMLPAPRSAKARSAKACVPAISFGQPLAGDAGQIASYGVEILRRIVGAFCQTLTALSSGANTFFAQIAAMLLADRAARETAALFGTVWPASSFSPQPTAYNLPGLPAWGNLFSPSFGNAWTTNPWGAFAQAAEMWSSMWALPLKAPLGMNYTNIARSRPEMATFTGPGFVLGFAWHPQS